MKSETAPAKSTRITGETRCTPVTPWRAPSNVAWLFHEVDVSTSSGGGPHADSLFGQLAGYARTGVAGFAKDEEMTIDCLVCSVRCGHTMGATAPWNHPACCSCRGPGPCLALSTVHC